MAEKHSSKIKLLLGKTRNFWVALFLGIIFAFAAVVFWFVFKKIFVDWYLTNINEIPFGLAIFISAFMGAFFAFILSRLATVLDAMRERRKLAYNKLVYLGYLLERCLKTIVDNQAILKRKIDLLEKEQVVNDPFILLPVEEETELGKVGNKNIIRPMISLISEIRTANRYIRNFNNMEEKFKECLLERKIADPQSARSNILAMANTLRVVEKKKHFLKLEKNILKNFRRIEKLTKRSPFIFNVG